MQNEPFRDWLDIDRTNVDALRRLSVDECPECEGGRMVRYCSAHGLNGVARR